jgi:hypothetical protein
MVKGVEGMNVAVVPLYVTVPEMGVEPFIRVKVDALTVDVVKVSLKVAVIGPLSPAPVVESVGLVDETVGGVISGAAPVVNDHEKFEPITLPSTSLTPDVIVAV